MSFTVRSSTSTEAGGHRRLLQERGDEGLLDPRERCGAVTHSSQPRASEWQAQSPCSRSMTRSTLLSSRNKEHRLAHAVNQNAADGTHLDADWTPGCRDRPRRRCSSASGFSAQLTLFSRLSAYRQGRTKWARGAGVT